MRNNTKKAAKVVVRTANTVQVFSLNTTSNDKIEGDKKRLIMQTYTFSRMQFELILQGIKFSAKEFFNSADSNCLDCPFNEYGKCYTHKAMQYSGFLSMLRSIAKQYPDFYLIPTLDDSLHNQVVNMAKDTYVRFGTYGEPSLHNVQLIEDCINVCSSYTGYTHQYMRRPELGRFFMASTHTAEQERHARELGYRSFVATAEKIAGLVNCPASKEAGYKSTCSKCALCSGTMGKGSKSVYILLH